MYVQADGGLARVVGHEAGLPPHVPDPHHPVSAAREEGVALVNPEMSFTNHHHHSTAP